MSIGTNNESSLHRDLKFRYAGQDGETEAEVAGFVADGINAEGEYIEVQTGSFGPLRKKALVLQGRLRVVYPVIISKYIEVFNKKGKLQYRRKSPRRGSAWDLFNVLVYAPDLPLIPGLVIELALVDAAEQRVQDGKGSWRRRGISIHDRQMLALHETITLEKPSDYIRFIPFKKNEKFTSALLAQRTGIPVDLARKALYVLVRLGIVKKTGKQGNSLVYAIKGSRGK
jgi:stalled ribosome alternative rescue factor ArfA